MLSNVKDIPDISRKINRSNSYYTTSPGDHHQPPQQQRITQQHRSYSRCSLPAQSFGGSHQSPSSAHTLYEDLSGYNSNTIKRSPSYQSTDNHSVTSKASTLSTTSSSRLNNHHHPATHTYVTGEHYETASTTTTLTPPPSECGGRETPLLGSNLHLYRSEPANNPPRPPSRQHHHHHHQQLPHLYIGDELDDNHHHNYQQQRVRHQSQPPRSSTLTTTISTTTTNTMDLQQKYRREQSPGQESNQSVVDHHQQRQQVIYATPQRPQTVELISVTSDEEVATPTASNRTSGEQSIPYHARETAQPFTYGDIAAAAAATANGDQQQQQGKGTGMLKMQSGLSSPSLVRKQLGQPQHKNVPVRNEFEEMLRIRREKVDNDKYSISDGGDNYKVNGSGGFSFDEKWRDDARPKSPGTVTFKRTVTTTTSRDPAPVSPPSNGYTTRSYEPVKRSNTMDYNRSMSSDG